MSNHLQVTAPEDYVGISSDSIQNSVAAFFEKSVQLNAKRIALKTTERAVTYEEFNRAANRIAHQILAIKAFRPLSDDLTFWETHAEPIAVFMNQGIDAIIAILGLLKAGKLFVLINPTDPNTRNGYILKHAPALAIVTDNTNLASAQDLAPSGCHIINIERIDPYVTDTNPSLNIAPLDPALLLYTSGSTGKPKGVIHPQRNLLHDILVKTDLMKISRSDQISLLAWGTGQAVKVILMSLLNGATLYPFNLKHEGLAPMAAWIRKEHITLLTISAPICRSFLELLKENESFPDLRLIRTASDTVYPEDIARLKAHFGPHCFYINALASNETGTICAYVINDETPLDNPWIPIGCTYVDGVTVCLLDETGNPVEPGAIGRMAITSRYITRGYWRDPDLTRASFVPNPDEKEVITFLSGDLARMQPNGLLELSGRNDFQVKIRGYRVETSEVEAKLLQHENVADALVQPHEDQQGNKRLVGYVVPRNYPAPTTSELHSFLRGNLTDYMIPAVFVVMEKIPQLPNGKTNRRALPAPGKDRPKLDNTYTAPATKQEKRLVEIWSKVTGIEQIGIHDNFMELGGDSLLASQVITRIIEAFGVDIPQRLLFESSTVAMISARIDEWRQINSGKQLIPSISRKSGNGPWELSHGQKQLWFLGQLHPNSPAYNMPKPIRLSGELKVEALAEAFEWLLGRHEVLRTNYINQSGIPSAVVAETSAFELPLVDLSQYTADERNKHLDRLMAAESLRPFDLEHDLKLRGVLYRLSTEEHVLLCVTHHIASDGWSRGVPVRELAAIYEALEAGEPPPLKKLSIQYSDFARWQTKQLETDTVSLQMEYWEKCLKDIPLSLDLPSDRPRPAEISFRGANHIVTIPKDKSQALIKLAQEEQVTLFMLLLAAMNTLLYRYTGQEDLVLGCPHAGRKAMETENMIGFFVNMLVMRNDLSGNPTFRQLLARVREVALSASANPEVPFEQLVTQLTIKRDLSRNPIFQIAFDVHRPRAPVIQGSNLTFGLMEMERQMTVFDQAWNIAISEEGLRVRVEYSTDLFDASTIERMVEHYKNLLDGILANPEAHLSELPILNQDEMRILQNDWSGLSRQVELPGLCIHELVEAQVNRTPQELALVLGEERLTYNELNKQADQVALHLQSMGVTKDTPVGVWAERSVEVLVGLLAILKAGGCYVPLNPDYPDDRIQTILENCNPPVLMTSQRTIDHLPAHNAEVILFEEIFELAGLPAAETDAQSIVERRSDPKSLAYVLYTSGSTAMPKGVAMPHEPLVNLTLWQVGNSAAERGSSTLQFASLSFDVSFQEIFSTWCSGGTLVLVSEETKRDAWELWDTIFNEKIERLFLPYVALQQMAVMFQVIGDDRLPGQLFEIITAGEQLVITKEIRALFERLPNCRLSNHYGPTETHVVTAHRLSEFPGEWPVLPPIGKPISNAVISILDNLGNPVPPGVAGEITVGGLTMARDYLNNAEPADEKKRTNPFADEAGNRVYRTGDIGRWLSNGEIEFLGRLDSQLKIRGHRVEPGEIEAVLGQYPGVKNCIVHGREFPQNGSIDKRLAAYVVPEKIENPPKPEAIMLFLKKKLPDYMLPSEICILQYLPTNQNGKIDYKALPDPSSAKISGTDYSREAHSTYEKILEKIWTEILFRDGIGKQENFFEIGGHSLKAMEVVSVVKSRLDIELTVRDIFDFPTLEELATQMDKKVSGDNQSP